jgi:hypothetical protein
MSLHNTHARVDLNNIKLFLDKVSLKKRDISNLMGFGGYSY